jgi:hypothetical protein
VHVIAAPPPDRSERVSVPPRRAKLSIYARDSVRHVWLVDPLARTLEVLRLENGRWPFVSTASHFDVVRLEPFDAIELDLSLGSASQP